MFLCPCCSKCSPPEINLLHPINGKGTLSNVKDQYNKLHCEQLIYSGAICLSLFFSECLNYDGLNASTIKHPQKTLKGKRGQLHGCYFQLSTAAFGSVLHHLVSLSAVNVALWIIRLLAERGVEATNTTFSLRCDTETHTDERVNMTLHFTI